MSDMINFAGEDAYYYCGSCGMELFGDEVGAIEAGRNCASGEFAPCLQCKEENGVYRDDGTQ